MLSDGMWSRRLVRMDLLYRTRQDLTTLGPTTLHLLVRERGPVSGDVRLT